MEETNVPNKYLYDTLPSSSKELLAQLKDADTLTIAQFERNRGKRLATAWMHRGIHVLLELEMIELWQHLGSVSTGKTKPNRLTEKGRGFIEWVNAHSTEE